MIDLPPHDSDVRNDGRTSRGSLYHHLTIPYWMVQLFRYIEVVAHEVSHPFVDELAALEAYREDSAERVVDLFDELRIVDVFGRRLRLDVVRRFARRVLSEMLADALAVRLMGPSYLAALGCYLLGTHEWTNETGARLTTPVYVRLKTLWSMIEDEGAPPGELGGLLGAVLHAAEARIERLGAGTAAEQVESVLQVRLQPIAERFVRQVLEDGGPERLSGDGGALVEGLHEIWSQVAAVGFKPGEPDSADLLASRDANPTRVEPPPLVATLQEVPEGALLVERELSSRPAAIKFGGAWAFLCLSVRVEEGEVATDTGALLATVRSFARPKDLPAEGVAGLALGPYDVVILREGARVRRGDQLAHAQLGALRPYVKRRMLLEVRQVMSSSGQAVYEADPGRLGIERPASALTEMQVEPSSWLAFAQDFLARVRGLDGVRPAAVFRGVGWANLVIVWTIERVAGLVALHEAGLAKEDGRMHRSVTSLLPKTLALGPEQPTVGWDQVDWEGAPTIEIVTSVRTNGSARIRSLPDQLEQARRGETVEARCDFVFGLYDALVRFTPSSGVHVLQAGDILWRSVADGTLRRSNTMIRFGDLNPAR